MRESTEHTAQQNRERHQTAVALLAILAFVVVGVLAFLRFYSVSIDDSLYGERLNQMREVTTQLFSGLEDVIKNQWQRTEEKCNTLQQEQPQTWDELHSFMSNQAELGDLDEIQCYLVAVDAQGWYYTQSGRQGLLNERKYLMSEPEQISFVSNALTNNETRMVFLRRLEQPIVLQNNGETISLMYYGLSQNMEELNPYFECSAYSGNSSVYVVDDDGLKLFSSSGDLLKGYNMFTTLRGMDYLHGTSFEDASAEFNERHIAYSNAMLGDEEIYYALYKMDSSAWTLIFLVPSQYVATNTVDLVNTTVRLVLTFAVALVIVSAAAIFWLSRRQQKAALADERRNNAKLERINGDLAKAVQVAEKAAKAKSDFLANMSHDIRTPMNAIVGITGLMEREKGTSDKMHTYIQKVQLSSRHLLSLINDILDMSKIESSEVALNRDSISLAEQVGQVDSIIRSQTNERGQTFHIRAHTIAHEHLIGDGVRLRQIFLNLLSNAVKYTQYGGTVQFDLAEIPCDVPDHARFRITVEDNGYGMTPEFVAKIFEPFTRAENSMTNKVQGTGLGMAITKSIVDLMGGTISVQSELNKGSCFTVELTFAIDHSVERPVHAQRILLLAEDQVLICNIEAALQETALDFCAVQSEDEAVAQLKKAPADVILLAGHLHDAALPETVRRLRQADRDAALLFCCDYAQQEQVHEILTGSGVDGLIARPFFLSNLSRAIDHLRSDETAQEEQSHSVLQGLRFLCAEDNDLNAEILEAVLEINGASCVIYPNGKALLDAFAHTKPGEYDAILMDVQMPILNGLEATRAIRAGTNPLGQTIPIIAMTANAFTEDIQDCLHAGMDAHISKPLDIGVLERTLRGLLHGSMPGGGHSFARRRQK